MEAARVEDEPALHIGDWVLDPGTQRLSRASVSHALNPKEMGVLTHLAECAPQLVTTQDLLDRTCRG